MNLRNFFFYTFAWRFLALILFNFEYLTSLFFTPTSVWIPWLPRYVFTVWNMIEMNKDSVFSCKKLISLVYTKQEYDVCSGVAELRTKEIFHETYEYTWSKFQVSPSCTWKVLVMRHRKVVEVSVEPKQRGSVDFPKGCVVWRVSFVLNYCAWKKWHH